MSATSGCLAGKVAFVTGAARGIGRAVALAFAREGADIAGFDIAGRASAIQHYAVPSEGDLQETGARVAACGRRWIGLVGDVRDLPMLRAAATRVEQEFGRIDILAAIAGIQAFKPLLEMQDEDWGAQIGVNLTGTANTIRAIAPSMAARRHGRIIVTGSTQGRHGMREGSAYSASKWGILGLMKSAALEFGAYGITVNAVIPGLIDTALTRNDDRYAQALKEGSGGKLPDPPLEPKVIAAQTAKTPLQIPWLAPEDVAPAYVFLASEAGRMVSGAAFDVTGGDSAHNVA